MNGLEDKAREAAEFIKLFANSHRLLILCLLIEKREMSVGEIHQYTPSLTLSALSQHLAKLREQGLVDFRRQDQTLFYHIADPCSEVLISFLKQKFCPEET